MRNERDIFNEIITHQRRLDDDAFIKGLLSFGLLHYYKLDRVLEYEEKNGKCMEMYEVQQVADSFTELEVNNFYHTAIMALEDYSRKKQAGFSDILLSKVTAHLSKPKFNAIGVWESAVGALCYSLLILVVFLLVKFLGGDLLTVLREVLKQ